MRDEGWGGGGETSRDAAEVGRVLRVLLAGTGLPETGLGGGGVKGFMEVGGPHAVRVYGAASGGKFAEVVGADGGLGESGAVAAGRELLGARRGAKHLPVLRKFGAAVAEGVAKGHWETVMALHAVEFSVAALPMLQSLLFAAWWREQPRCGVRGLDEFFRQSGGLLNRLPTLLRGDEPDRRPVFSIVR